MILSLEADSVGDRVSYSVATRNDLDVRDSSWFRCDKQTTRNRHNRRIILIKCYRKAAGRSHTLWCNNTKQIELNEFPLVNIIVLIRDQVTQPDRLCGCVRDRKIRDWVEWIEALGRIQNNLSGVLGRVNAHF